MKIFDKLNAIPIEDLFKRYKCDYILDKVGYNTHCPFPAHSYQTGKTPPFRYYQETNSFACFGCGAGGGPVAFVAHMEGISFKEAAKKLAKMYDLGEISTESRVARMISDLNRKEQEDDFARSRNFILSHIIQLRKANNNFFTKLEAKLSLDFYLFMYMFHKRLKFDEVYNLLNEFNPSQDGQFYTQLFRRDFSQYFKEYREELDKHQRVFLNHFTGFEQFIQQRSFNQEDFLKATMAAYIPFKDPLANEFKFIENSMALPVLLGKHYIGTIFRNIGPTDIKYIVYLMQNLKKSDILYGIDEKAILSMSKENYIIFVEGPLDLIRLRTMGIYNAVAIQHSKMLSKAQVKLATAFVDKLYFMFDGDDSGYEASQKGMEFAKQLETSAKIIQLPPDQDPDSYGAFSEYALKTLIQKSL